MTPDEARELFSAAHDGELEAGERGRFDQALEADEALAAEFADFSATIAVTSRLSRDVAAPDLLPSIQDRIRRRSGGRFYRDRFAQRSGARGLFPMLLTTVILTIVAIVWFMMHHVQLEAPSHEPPSGQHE